MTQRIDKALIVFRNLHLGGAERQGLLLARFLREELKAEVTVWGLDPEPGRVAELCDRYRIPWRGLSFPLPAKWYGWPPELIMFARKLRTEAPDVVIPYTLLPNLVCGLTWRLAGARLSVWNQEDEGFGLERRPLDRLAVALTPCFISNSVNGARHLTDNYPVRPDRVAVIPNGVSLEPPRIDRPAWRARLGIGPDCFVACMVANITASKDHATLLAAWRTLRDGWQGGRPGPVLLLAGRLDESGERARELAARLELEDSVRFPGPVDDVAGLLRASDLCVFSSKSEGVPNGVLEAMAAGLPVAGTDIPGIREAVGVEGLRFLAPPGDADALAGQIAVFAGDEALRADVGARMKQRIDRDFTAAGMCRGTLAFIERNLAIRR